MSDARDIIAEAVARGWLKERRMANDDLSEIQPTPLTRNPVGVILVSMSRAINTYLTETVIWGGIPTTRAEMHRELEADGLTPTEIDQIIYHQAKPANLTTLSNQLSWLLPH